MSQFLTVSTQLFRALRYHQWIKNSLIFIPMLLAHEWFLLEKWNAGIFGFGSFCLGASSIYIVNDLQDLEADRAHPVKKKRPFAAAVFRPAFGYFLSLSCAIFSLVLALVVGKFFTFMLLAYFAITMAYTFWLKKVAILDVITLASLYTLRLFAGSAATDTPLSEWLLAFSLFLFLSLALVKRYSELFNLREAKGSQSLGRGYFAPDLEFISSLGGSSGYIAVLVLVLYLQSPEVQVRYLHPDMLWALVLAVLFWVSRIWLFAHRGKMNEDPIVFALSDKTSYFLGLLVFAVLLSARSV